MVFLDTSALVKAYVEERGTESVRGLLARGDTELFLSKHVALETLATFAYKLRDQQITTRRYREIRADFYATYQRYNVVPVTDDTIETAIDLADQHRKLGVGSVDLIHVATALEIQARVPETPLTIICADRSMRLLARAAGFEVFDPETDDVARLGVPPDEA
ncbi:MAG TPA: type II toxin-antitoxin system VapC family toxin [Longimicrobium sp.]|nr:type II toxin-antitoxin system VapC family toxin [Longimicrobium sp.]